MRRDVSERLTKMKMHRSKFSRQDGFALIYMAATLTVLLLFTGVAVDSGRAYVVKAQLTNDESRGRRCASGGAQPQQRKPQDRGDRNIQSQFSHGIYGNDLGRPDHRCRLLQIDN
ncbi:MAG: hypothetical protein DMF92_15635 [Acidobacteria bacterium]|nr:MAG: hypothetical protein DMF92_15635 [Acidobacteriota bacterium]